MTQYIGDTQFPDYSSQPKPTVPAPWMQINAEGDTITAYDFTGLIYPKAMFAGTRYKNIDLVFPDVLDAQSLFQGSSVVSSRIILPKCTNIRSILRACPNLTDVYVEAPLTTEANAVLNASSNVRTAVLIFPETRNIDNVCDGCPNVQNISITSPKVVTAIRAFYYCNALEELTLNIPELTSAMLLTSGNVSLKSFQATWPKISDLTDAFNNTGLDATALNSIFESLPTYTTGTHNIGIKGAVGAATCDISIATQKGWTVVR